MRRAMRKSVSHGNRGQAAKPRGIPKLGKSNFAASAPLSCAASAKSNFAVSIISCYQRWPKTHTQYLPKTKPELNNKRALHAALLAWPSPLTRAQADCRVLRHLRAGVSDPGPATRTRTATRAHASEGCFAELRMLSDQRQCQETTVCILALLALGCLFKLWP